MEYPNKEKIDIFKEALKKELLEFQIDEAFGWIWENRTFQDNSNKSLYESIAFDWPDEFEQLSALWELYKELKNG